MKEKFYLGLDIGTDSVGYAVTNEDYELVRLKGKDAWGVRMFENAKTAVERRTIRANRRRRERRKNEIVWLQELFAKEIEKVDKDLFIRMKYSSLFYEDKPEELKQSVSSSNNLLFNEPNYKDKDFYKEYATIFHLRQELLTKPAKDVKFLYLALHSILKHRGHFVSNINYELQSSTDIKDTINDLVTYYNEIFNGEEQQLKIIQSENELEDILFNESKSKVQAKKEIKLVFNAPKGLGSAICECLVNGKLDTKVFNKDYDVKVDFNLEEDKMNEAEDLLCEDEFVLLEKVKESYQIIQLKKVLNGEEYICSAMVKIYEQHKKQLKMFKDFVKKFYPAINGEKSEFYKMFKNPVTIIQKAKKIEISESKNYASYIDNDYERNKKTVLNYDSKNFGQEEFYKVVKALLKKSPTLENYNEEEFLAKKTDIERLMENNMFLNKLRTSSNSLFPNSLYIKEIKQILKVNSQKFEFLKETDEYGSIEDKILSIFKYRVPYYVGPITTKDNSKHKWLIYKDTNLKLYPWTLNHIIDLDATEQEFIQRMTNKCTYLGKDILPKNSIIYQRFCVLNELNKLTINGEQVPEKLKQEIFEELFSKKKKVSGIMLKNYLIKKGYANVIDIGGIDNQQFANSYSSFVTFSEKYGKDYVYKNLEMFEEIIKLHTILSDKGRVENLISQKYNLPQEMLKYLKSLNFQGWGRLSREFLELEVIDETTGEIISIIKRMYDTNQNLNEVINDSRLTKTNTNLTIQEYLKNVSARQMEITYEDIENSYASPSVKRAAWQAIRIVKEITKLMGEKPDKIFVEVTRKDGEKGDNGRKASRTKKIEKIYESKEFQSEITKFGIELKEFKELQEGLSKESDGGKLRAEKTYLYYLQNGKCMYSLDSIDINKLENYDIDHVIPQSILKDDSFDNKVLVKKELNESSDIGKSDKFPIYNWNPTLYQKCKPYWEFLLKHGMISKKKFEILTRKTELTDDEKQAFINRQLVETNQSVKLVCDMLKGYVNNPQDIVYSKASNVTDFRKEFEIVKFRDINDYHHARDAYLNIVVGNVLHNRFTQRYKKDKDRTFINKELQQEENVNNNRTYHIIDLFKSNKPIYKYNDKNAIVWDKNKHLDQVKKICQKNSCTMSYFTTIKENGTFYDQSVYKSLNNDPTSKASVPLKDKDSKYIQNVGYSSIEKYGGYNSLKISYFMIIESKDKKGKTILTIESVPTYVCQKYKNQINKREKILEYLTKENDLIEPKIVIESLHCRSLLEIGGGKYLITTKTGNQCVLKNVNQWNATKEIVSYSKTLSKYLALNDNIRETLKATENEILVSERKNKKSEIISREKNIELYNKIVEQLSKRMYINDTVYKKMKEETEFFKSLDLKQQIELLNNIVKYLGGSFTVNIEYINGLKESGKIRIKKDITNLNITLIKQSVTGLKEKKVKIK